MVIAHLDIEGPLYCLVLMKKLKTRECGLQFGWRYKLSGYLMCLHVQSRPGVIYLFYTPVIPGLELMMMGEICYSKVCGNFFSLQKEVISHFDWGLKSHSVPLVPQKYQHAHSSPARECHGQWAQPFIQRFSYHFYSFEQT